ncbi:single-stranded DNA-binding protein [Helcococcus kunzii]|uniref:single-stranded DNA-binding protein n=1 Tax=Helcococcus kunzii TaxID=40091 RepID=UPI0038A3EA66
MANNVVISGRLTKRPEMRYINNSNQAVCRFTVAVDKNLTNEKKREFEAQGKPTADFINIVAWGRLGENVAKYTDKGLRVLVTGSIQTGSYEKDGQRIYTTDINASNVEFLDWKDSNSTIGKSPNVDDEFEYSADFDPTEDARIPF